MPSFLNDFEQRVQKKEAKVAVVGLGYVGLPLAVAFAKKGFSVRGIELDRDRLLRLKAKKSYILDVPESELVSVLNRGTLQASNDFSSLKDTDVVLICVPTPLKNKYTPNISYIKQAVKSIAGNIKKGALIILESTTYPGTTEEVILPLLEERGLKHNRDFYLVFSPERIDPGNILYPVEKIPKVVGGVTPQATKMAEVFYKQVLTKVVPVSSARTAEAAKLLENTFRLINIGLIDEMAMMAHRMGLDIWEIIEAAKTKPFGFMPFYPGPGVGGHCIPKDPLYLYWKARHHGFNSRFIKLASDVIAKMPEYIAMRVMEILRKNRATGRQVSILVMGVTYKKDIKDLRKSPALDVIAALQKKKARVSYFDPLIPYLKINSISLQSVAFKKEVLRKFDCVVIATDHSTVDYQALRDSAKLIFDCRNVYGGIHDERIIRL